MNAQLLENKKKFTVSLRLIILTIFISVFVFAICALIGFDYIYSSRILLKVATNLMEKSATSVKGELYEKLNDVAEIGNATAQGIQDGIINSNKQQLTEYTVALVRKLPIIDAAWFGDMNGNFIIAETEEDKTISSEIFDRTTKPPTHIILHRNLEGDLIGKTHSKDLSYDPRARFWFNEAKEAKKLIWTDIHPINVLNRPHYIEFVAAVPVYKKNGVLYGVFGLNITLDYLTRVIQSIKITPNGIIYIVTEDGKLIAFPGISKQFELMDIHDINDKSWVVKSFDLFKKKNKPTFPFTYQHQKYLASYATIPHFLHQGWLIGVVVPEDDFVGELKKVGFANAILGLGILLIGVILILNLISRIVNPIKKLVTQTDKIKEFKLDDEDQIQSRIKEIRSLADAIFAMRLGLKSFQQYVPATLVRQLIETKQHAHIGGSRKTLAIFFSDIENFTTISESMEPNQLMEHVCVYFDEMSQILVEEKCTIDKYIGDSVMGFWGAPLEVDLPSHHAARAALKCMRRLKELNSSWKSQGKPELITRMGLHKGDAIVGNIGSSERLNYTAIGDAINVASRLEGLNKIYGTKIIVSRSVYDEINKDFILRKVDEVALRGRIAVDEVFELLAKDKNELSFDIDQYNYVFEKAFFAYKNQQWQEAIKLFNSCLALYPEDTVVLIFIERCKSAV